jgi:membrane protease YdiL (CAAX protease family)
LTDPPAGGNAAGAASDPGNVEPPPPNPSSELQPTDDAAQAAPPAVPPGRALGLFRFTIEGRAAPGLFVGGWLATLLGGAAAFVGLLAGTSIPAVVLYVAGLGVALLGLVLLAGSQAIERRAAGLAYAGPAPVLVLAITFIAIYFVGAIVGTGLVLVGAFDDPADRPFVDLLSVGLQALIAVAVLRLVVVGSGALSWRDMGLRPGRGQALRDLLMGAAYAIPVIFITGFVVQALVRVIGETPESPLPPSGTSLGLAVNLIAGALIAPLYEELLFRGFATTAWARVVGATSAVIRTSILFALAHAISQQGETFSEALGIAVVAAAARLPVALALGWLFGRRGSLWAAVGLHATFNGLLIILAEYVLRNPLPVT